MSEVSLTIGGRNFAVSCADGEEAHLASLGAMIDSKLAGMGVALGPNESRNFLFAALLLADELHERGKELLSSKDELVASATELAQLRGKIGPLESECEAGRLRLEELAGERDALKIAASDAESARVAAQERASALEQQQLTTGDALQDAQAEATKATEALKALQNELDSRNSKVGTLRDELEALQAELAKAQEQAAQSRSEASELSSQVEELRTAQDAMVAERDGEREAAAALASELEELRNAPPAPEAPEFSQLAMAEDPDLAPALEKFAALLESCADKLEGKAANA